MDHRNSIGRPSQPSAKNRVNKANRKTNAARLNAKVLEGLAAALSEDPEADLTTLLSSTYSEQLRSFKTPRPANSHTAQKQSFPYHDIRSRLDATDPFAIVSKLSTDIEHILRHGVDHLPRAVIDLLNHSTEVLYEGPWAASVMVFRVDESIIAKVTHERYTQTEYRTLAYLEEHLPALPVPRLHGVIHLGIYHVLFMDFVPGLDLEKAWPQLDNSQKQGISRQLDSLFSELRTLPFPADASLGGVDGQGCKDARRGTRLSTEPITTTQQFEDFVFSGSKTASPLYTWFLRHLLPTSSAASRIVFTHGDLRPANIMVRGDENGTWTVAAIIDWDSSGFYPEYWESIKMTNNLTTREKSDWYKFLPESLSPRTYPIQWLVDRIWDPSMDNS